MKFASKLAVFGLGVLAWSACAVPLAFADNLSDAQGKYSIPDEHVTEVSSIDDLGSELSSAASLATADEKRLVHIGAGTYSVSTRIRVPENVILVAEKNSVFNVTQKITGNNGVQVYGVLFGGTWNANDKVERAVCFGYETFKNGNGIVERVTANKAKFGITARMKTTQGAQVIDCTANNCTKSGINSLANATIKLIKGCTTNGSAEAGINLVSGNVTTIEKCTIKDNKKHGISTDTEVAVASDYDVTVSNAIGTITGCTIQGNGGNGIYFEGNTTCKKMTKNNISKNKGAGMNARVMKGFDKKTVAPVVKGIANNTFTANKNTNIISYGGKVTIGNANTITKSGNHGIHISHKGTVTISGKKNKINSNKNYGICIISGKLKVTGKGNNATKNGKAKNINTGSYKKSLIKY